MPASLRSSSLAVAEMRRSGVLLNSEMMVVVVVEVEMEGRGGHGRMSCDPVGILW